MKHCKTMKPENFNYIVDPCPEFVGNNIFGPGYNVAQKAINNIAKLTQLSKASNTGQADYNIANTGSIHIHERRKADYIQEFVVPIQGNENKILDPNDPELHWRLNNGGIRYDYNSGKIFHKNAQEGMLMVDNNEYYIHISGQSQANYKKQLIFIEEIAKGLLPVNLISHNVPAIELKNSSTDVAELYKKYQLLIGNEAKELYVSQRPYDRDIEWSSVHPAYFHLVWNQKSIKQKTKIDSIRNKIIEVNNKLREKSTKNAFDEDEINIFKNAAETWASTIFKFRNKFRSKSYFFGKNTFAPDQFPIEVMRSGYHLHNNIAFISGASGGKHPKTGVNLCVNEALLAFHKNNIPSFLIGDAVIGTKKQVQDTIAFAKSLKIPVITTKKATKMFHETETRNF